MFDVPLDRFEAMVSDALDAVPDPYASEVVNVRFEVEEDSQDGNLLGLYRGVPLTKRWGASPMMPDRITLYRKTICASCSSEEEVRSLIYSVVVHELGHYFGFSDKRLRELGW